MVVWRDCISLSVRVSCSFCPVMRARSPAHLLDLVLQIEQAATQLAVFVGQPLVGLLAHGLDALPQVEDGSASLVILEQCGLRPDRNAKQGGGQRRASQHSALHHRV
jgi:hypothetical protein